jgi:hypothetical protein
MLERREGPFIAPQENLAIGVSETRTCSSRGQTYPANLFGNRLEDWICPICDLVVDELS